MMLYEYLTDIVIKSIIIAPVVATIILYFFVKHFSKYRWKAIHISTQWTAIFYVVAVSLLIELRFSISLLGSFLIAILLFLSIHLIFQWKKDTEVILGKGLKVVSRFCFLLFGFAYLALLTFEMFEWITQ